MAVERCVICGRKTEYEECEPIRNRYGYIEGVGQVCCTCEREIEKSKKRDKRRRRQAKYGSHYNYDS